VFGEEAEEGEENCFQGRIKQILRVTLEALLTISEVAYTQLTYFLFYYLLIMMICVFAIICK